MRKKSKKFTLRDLWVKTKKTPPRLFDLAATLRGALFPLHYAHKIAPRRAARGGWSYRSGGEKKKKGEKGKGTVSVFLAQTWILTHDKGVNNRNFQTFRCLLRWKKRARDIEVNLELLTYRGKAEGASLGMFSTTPECLFAFFWAGGRDVRDGGNGKRMDYGFCVGWISFLFLDGEKTFGVVTFFKHWLSKLIFTALVWFKEIETIKIDLMEDTSWKFN